MKTVSAARDMQSSSANLANDTVRESDDGYRRLVEGLPAAIYKCDLDGRVSFYNRAAAVLWGREPMIGTDLWCGSWRIYHLDGTPLALDQCPMAITLREGRAIDGEEIVIERPDGTRRHALAHSQPIYDHGAMVGAVNMLLDVTEIRRTEQSLRESEERFRTVAIKAPAAIFVKDLAGRYTLANPLACRALGRTEGVTGLTDHDLLPPKVADLLHQHDVEVIEAGEAVEYEEVVERDGFFADYLSVKFPLFDAQGRAVGVCGVSTDITARKRAENARRESEERFVRFMQHLPGLAWIKDEAGRYVFANDAASKVFQIAADKLIGKTDGDVFPADTAAQFIENDRQALTSESGIQTVESLKHADDEIHYSLVSKFPIPSLDGAPSLIGGMAIDITSRKHAEESLRESEERFRTLAAHAPVGIFMSAANGNSAFVNERWCEMAGLTAEEARGTGWTRALHPDDHERVVAGWNAATGDGDASAADFRFLRPDGVVTWLQGNAVPLLGSDGKTVGYIGTLIDVTKRVQAEESLREADQRKDEFLAILAHELRNPLAPIRTGLELMRIAGDDAALIEEVRATMERQTQQMVRLIDDLLDVSRITRGTMELRMSRVELASVVQHAVEAARPIVEEQGHRLTVELPKQPLLLDADPSRLAQVISNLLNNAAKYMEAGGQIRLIAERIDDTTVVRVVDHGIGIPAEMLDRIFDMFSQVDRSLERSHGGLGIGLTLVKRLVDMHGGTVAAHSNGPGQGSEFVVTLPLSTTAIRHTSPTDGEHVAAAGRRRILVVDDNESAARVLGLLLEAFGNEVRTACDGLSAVEAAAEYRPDIVFMDIGMPKLNGYDAARRIRDQPWGKHMVLAALTGWGQEEDKIRTREAGFDHHFVKPIDAEVLRRLLADHSAGKS